MQAEELCQCGCEMQMSCDGIRISGWLPACADVLEVHVAPWWIANGDLAENVRGVAGATALASSEGMSFALTSLFDESILSDS
jgi:hypothetical protein